MKKLIAFDLDETLNETRTLMSDKMAELLEKYLINSMFM